MKCILMKCILMITNYLLLLQGLLTAILIISQYFYCLKECLNNLPSMRKVTLSSLATLYTVLHSWKSVGRMFKA